MDIDGVLCPDPTPAQDDDGPRYEAFLREVQPLIIPTVTVGWLVTCRLEKYRALTSEWLAKHGIRYRELIMLDFPDKASRAAANCWGSFKAQVYNRTRAFCFIESSHRDAVEISRITGCSVFCTETRNMLNAGTVLNSPANRWLQRAEQLIVEIDAYLPKSEAFVLVENAELGEGFASSRDWVPFLERNGCYWGAPTHDEMAIEEFDRIRRSGTRYIVFAWPAFWWFDHYKEFYAYLQANAREVVRTEVAVIFALYGRSELPVPIAFKESLATIDG
jgi:hypothetical protein